MGSDNDRFRAVMAGVIRAAASSSEFTALTEKMGLKVLVHAHDVTPDFVRFCTYMSSKTIATRPDDAAKFLASSIQAYRYAMKNRDAVVKLTREMTGAKDDDLRAEYVFDEVLKYDAIDTEMGIDRRKLEWMRSLFVKTETLQVPVDLDKFIDGRMREKALVIAGSKG
jgi:ABC-type nitrate/sulfonate/bicarbonate transport system substrate-binding protein